MEKSLVTYIGVVHVMEPPLTQKAAKMVNALYICDSTVKATAYT